MSETFYTAQYYEHRNIAGRFERGWKDIDTFSDLTAALDCVDEWYDTTDAILFRVVRRVQTVIRGSIQEKTTN